MPSPQALSEADRRLLALGAAAYAAKAAALASAEPEPARRDEVRWQLEQLTPELREALVRLPLLGEDSSGPLGPGLLASGVLAASIREIQGAMAEHA